MLTSTIYGGNIHSKPPRTVEEGGGKMFPNLKAEMVRNNITSLDLAKATRRTTRSINDKIAGRSEFTLNEALSIRNDIFPGMTVEYLFAKEAKPGT